MNIIRAPYTLDLPGFERVQKLIAAQPELFGPSPSLGERRAAFAVAAPHAKRFFMPDTDLTWQAGSMTLATRPIAAADPEADTTALDTANSGGIIHFGAIGIPTPNALAATFGVCALPIAQATILGSAAAAQIAQAAAKLPPTRAVALAQAYQNCGAYIFVPDSVVLTTPLQIIWTYPEGTAQAVFPRIVVILGRGAKATIIERHLGEGDALVAGTVEISLEEDAALHYVVVQRVAENTRMHMTRTHAVAANAKLQVHCIDLGGAATNLRLNAKLYGKGATHTLGFLSLRTGMQRSDMTVTIDHQQPLTQSVEIIRAVISSRGSFKIASTLRMKKKAVRSGAMVEQRGLLFSPRARFESQPHRLAQQHRIHVRQITGVGSLDEETLFYILARGISRPEAIRMVTLAFFEPAMAGLPSEILKDEVRTALDDAIDHLTLRL